MNTEPKVSVNILPPDIKIQDVPMALVIVFSMILGGLLVLIIAITDWFSYKIDKLKLKRKLNLITYDFENCQKENEKLKEENATLKTEVENLQNQLSLTQQENQNLANEISKLKEENQLLNQKIDVLIDQLDLIEKERKEKKEESSEE
jgi:peptidoglycan hydrolase CwlO-like protein